MRDIVIEQESTQKVHVRAKVWLESEGEYVFGFGICNILEAIESTGSIKQAAVTVSKSYRHTWSRIKAVEEHLGITLVETRVGGGDAHRSDLTPAGKTLVTEYRRLRADVMSLVEQRFEQTVSDLIADTVDRARLSD